MNHDALAYASLSISGDAVLPEFWTRYFSVEPDISITKDSPFSTPFGVSGKRRTGVWSVSSKAAVQSDLLDQHLRYLIRHLGLPRQDLRDLVHQSGAKMRFFCYWLNDKEDRTPEIAEDIRELMSSLGGTIDIDGYRF